MDNETVAPVFTNTSKAKKMNANANENGTIDLYYFAGSPPCRSVMMLAKAVGVQLNLKPTNIMAGEHMTPEFLKMNPQHVIPTLNDKGFTLWESRAILQYLVDKYAKDDTLNPKDARKAALVNQRLYFDACTLYKSIYEYYCPVFKEDAQPDPERAVKFEEALGLLDEFMQGQVWVAGQYMTVADFAIVATISTAEAVGFDIGKYPNVNAWYERAQKAMADYGYEEINETGCKIFREFFKSKLK